MQLLNPVWKLDNVGSWLDTNSTHIIWSISNEKKRHYRSSLNRGRRWQMPTLQHQHFILRSKPHTMLALGPGLMGKKGGCLLNSLLYQWQHKLRMGQYFLMIYRCKKFSGANARRNWNINQEINCLQKELFSSSAHKKSLVFRPKYPSSQGKESWSRWGYHEITPRTRSTSALARLLLIFFRFLSAKNSLQTHLLKLKGNFFKSAISFCAMFTLAFDLTFGN